VDKYRLAMVFPIRSFAQFPQRGENVGLYLSEHRLKTAPRIDRIITEKLEFLGLKGVKTLSRRTLWSMKKTLAIARPGDRAAIDSLR